MLSSIGELFAASILKNAVPRPRTTGLASTRTHRTGRNSVGSSIAELPAALMILLIILFFPMLNLVGLGLSYASCATLNNVQLREAALIPFSQSNKPNGPVRQAIPEAWVQSGLGRFVHLNDDPDTKVSTKAGQLDPESGIQEQIVIVQTDFELRPFLVQDSALLPKVPGLNRPIHFTFTTERPIENYNNAAL